MPMTLDNTATFGCMIAINSIRILLLDSSPEIKQQHSHSLKLNRK
jgi:hypothetical protein